MQNSVRKHVELVSFCKRKAYLTVFMEESCSYSWKGKSGQIFGAESLPFSIQVLFEK